MTGLTVSLPWPPSVNHYWVRTKRGVKISKAGLDFRETVCGIVLMENIRPFTGALHVEIDAYPPDRRRRDLDNILKALLDALQHGGAYDDDSQIARLYVRKRHRVESGRVVVTITELGADE